MADKEKKERRKRKGERPDGLIQVSLQIGYKPDGKPERKFFYGHSRAEAEAKREQYKKHNTPGSSRDPNITVKEWVEEFKATYRTKVNVAYLRNDDAPYTRLVNSVGKMRMADVRETDLQKALNAVAGKSFSTVTKYQSVIKRVFKKARKNKIIMDDPADDLIRPPYTKGSHRALEAWEIDLILENWSDKSARTGLWIMLMMLCGLRRGEMMALRWENVDLENRLLSVKEVAVIETNQATIEERAKSDAGLRTLPICKALNEALLSIPAEKRTGLVCLSAKGKALSDSSFDRGLEQFCRVMERILNDEPTDQRGRRSDIEKKKKLKEQKGSQKIAQPQEPTEKEPRKKFLFRAHDLRHTYATALYDAGVPVKAAQYFLGHSDIKITLDLYTHLSREREEKSRMQMVSHLDSWIDNRLLVKTPFVDLDPENLL